MAFWFKSEWGHSNRWLWILFNMASKTITLSSSTVSRTQKHTQFLGELDCRNHHKDRKQSRNKCHSTKLRTQLTKHYWKKYRNFKNNAYHHTASTIYKKKLGCTNRNECNKTWGSYSIHLTFLTLVIRKIHLFHW